MLRRRRALLASASNAAFRAPRGISAAIPSPLALRRQSIYKYSPGDPPSVEFTSRALHRVLVTMTESVPLNRPCLRPFKETRRSHRGLTTHAHGTVFFRSPLHLAGHLPSNPAKARRRLRYTTARKNKTRGSPPPSRVHSTCVDSRFREFGLAEDDVALRQHGVENKASTGSSVDSTICYSTRQHIRMVNRATNLQDKMSAVRFESGPIHTYSSILYGSNWLQPCSLRPAKVHGKRTISTSFSGMSSVSQARKLRNHTIQARKEVSPHWTRGLKSNGILRMRVNVPYPKVLFKASPPMRIAHTMPLFNYHTEEQWSANTVNEVQDVDDSNTNVTSGPSNTSVGLLNNTDGADPPNESPAGEQNPTSTNNDMGETFDPDLPSESDSEQDESDMELDSESEADIKEEHPPLSYQIPAEVLQSAIEALPNTRPSFWGQRLYRGPDGQAISVHYCRTKEVAERVAKYFLDEKVIGFDIEWRPWAAPWSIKENASLIQLACEDRIALFHVALFAGSTARQLLPTSLKTVLESPDILKVGVAIKQDFTRLQKHLDLLPQGVVELSRLHNLVEYGSSSFKLVALATQVRHHLLLPLYKGQPLADQPGDETEDVDRKGSVRESDWSKALDMGQIQYAADDAYAGFRLWDVLESKRRKLKPVPALPRLCDNDPKPAEPRKTTKPKSKVTKKSKADSAQVVAEALGATEEDTEDTQGYETAPEEVEGDEEVDELESASESSSEGVESDESDADADYVPRKRERITEERPEGFQVRSRPTRRVGRFDTSRLNDADPGYPILPAAFLGESDSEDSIAFDPPPRAPSQGMAGKAFNSDMISIKASTQVEEDQYADSELEDALVTMELDENGQENVEANEDTTGDPISMSSSKITGEAESIDIVDPNHPDSFQSAETLRPTFKSLVDTTTAHTTEFIQATHWAQSYLHTTVPPATSSAPPRIRATVPPLRAYHLWHHQRLPLDTIGAHLRDPPLAQSTVSNYILQAIHMEKLEYNDDKLRDVLSGMPASVRMGRWGWLSRRVGITQ